MHHLLYFFFLTAQPNDTLPMSKGYELLPVYKNNRLVYKDDTVPEPKIDHWFITFNQSGRMPERIFSVSLHLDTLEIMPTSFDSAFKQANVIKVAGKNFRVVPDTPYYHTESIYGPAKLFEDSIQVDLKPRTENIGITCHWEYKPVKGPFLARIMHPKRKYYIKKIIPCK